MIATFFLSNCGGGSSSGTNSSETAQGKLAQGYVYGAQVWLDKITENQLGNFKRDPGEFDTTSDSDGNYQLDLKSGNYLIASNGGNFLDSSNTPIAAVPMLAPLPEVGQQTVNITPVTTLVAAQPELKNSLKNLGDWNSDIADPNGTPAAILRIAKTVESLSRLLSQGKEPIALNSEATIKSIALFAKKLTELPAAELSSQSTLKNASLGTLDSVLSDSALVRVLGDAEKDLVKESASQLVDAITSSIPESGQVVENQVVSDIEKKAEEVGSEIEEALTEQIIVVFGGFGAMNFDPMITEIKLEWIGTTLELTAQVVDESTESLVFNWSTESNFTIENSGSLNSTISSFDNETIAVILMVTDSSGVIVTESCMWSVNPTICSFLSPE